MAWTKAAVTGTEGPKDSRMNFSAFMHPSHERMYIFGGCKKNDINVQFDDVWVLDTSSIKLAVEKEKAVETELETQECLFRV